MKHTTWKSISLALVTFATISPCIANPDASPTEVAVTETSVPLSEAAFPAMRGADKASRGLELTDVQKEKVYQLKSALSDAVGPKRLELQKQQRQLKDLLTQPTLDRAAITNAQTKINSLHAEIANLMVNFRADFSEQLTAEQRQKLRYRSMSGRHGHKHRAQRALS